MLETKTKVLVTLPANWSETVQFLGQWCQNHGLSGIYQFQWFSMTAYSKKILADYFYNSTLVFLGFRHQGQKVCSRQEPLIQQLQWLGETWPYRLHPWASRAPHASFKATCFLPFFSMMMEVMILNYRSGFLKWILLWILLEVLLCVYKFRTFQKTKIADWESSSLGKVFFKWIYFTTSTDPSSICFGLCTGV